MTHDPYEKFFVALEATPGKDRWEILPNGQIRRRDWNGTGAYIIWTCPIKAVAGCRGTTVANTKLLDSPRRHQAIMRAADHRRRTTLRRRILHAVGLESLP